MGLRENLGKLAAFAVAVLLVILGLTVNLNTIKSWVFGTNIVVSSTMRGATSQYFTGEVLRFSLDGIQSSKVFWAFDEGQPVVGSIEAQFAFLFETDHPKGHPRDHRVDAFFKIGDRYRSASALVRTMNVEYAANIRVDDSQIMVAAPSDFAAEWSLTSTSLALFSRGQFSDRRTLRGRAETGFVATKKDAFDTFGYSDKAELATALHNDERAWTWYEFKNKTTGEPLTIAQPLAQQK